MERKKILLCHFYLFSRIGHQSTLDKCLNSIFSETKAMKRFLLGYTEHPVYSDRLERDHELKLRLPFWANKLTISLNGIPVLWRTRVYVGIQGDFT